VLLPTDFDSYRHYSRQFKAAVAEIAPVIEDRGIDEIYIDLSDLPGIREPVGHDPLGGVRACALEIKNNVRRATGLTCSSASRPTSSSRRSPRAGQARRPRDRDARRHPDAHLAPAGAPHQRASAPRPAPRLDDIGIHTIGELAARDVAWLSQHFTVRTAQWAARRSTASTTARSSRAASPSR
jgi:DNA polymerase-4